MSCPVTGFGGRRIYLRPNSNEREVAPKGDKEKSILHDAHCITSSLECSCISTHTTVTYMWKSAIGIQVRYHCSVLNRTHCVVDSMILPRKKTRPNIWCNLYLSAQRHIRLNFKRKGGRTKWPVYHHNEKRFAFFFGENAYISSVLSVDKITPAWFVWHHHSSTNYEYTHNFIYLCIVLHICETDGIVCMSY